MHLLGDTVVVMRRGVEWISVSGYHLSGDAMRPDFRHTDGKTQAEMLGIAKSVICASPRRGTHMKIWITMTQSWGCPRCKPAQTTIRCSRGEYSRGKRTHLSQMLMWFILILQPTNKPHKSLGNIKIQQQRQPAFLFLLPPTCCISFPFITSLEKDVCPVCPCSFASARAGFIFPRTSAAVEPCPPWGPFPSTPAPAPPPPHWLQGVWAFHSAANPMYQRLQRVPTAMGTCQRSPF